MTDDSIRPFDDIPEVGYSQRHDTWLMLLTETGDDEFAPIIAAIGDFSVSRHGRPDQVVEPRDMSEHDAYQLIAAGIRIGEARARARREVSDD